MPPMPKPGTWTPELDRMLPANKRRPPRERLTSVRPFRDLRELGHAGGYDAVRSSARGGRRKVQSSSATSGV